MANAYHLWGYLQYQQYGQIDASLKNLETAQALYSKLRQQDEVARVQSRIEQIRQQPKTQGDVKPLSQLLDEVVQSRSVLVDLEAAIKTKQNTLAEIESRYAKAEIEVNKLLARQRSLTGENVALEAQINENHAQIASLQTRSELIRVSQNMPLWAAVVRAEIADGEITNLTLPLLERLRSMLPQYTLPLIAEIRARNGIRADELIELSHLEGDERLFAGVANSITLEADDPLSAVEVLLDSWETYLINVSGNAQ